MSFRQHFDRAFSLIEVVIAAGIATIILIAAYQALTMAARQQKDADARSSRALLEAELLERLMRDWRSCVKYPHPENASVGIAEFNRMRNNSGNLESCTVRWTSPEPNFIVREEKGPSDKTWDRHSYDFRKIAGPNEFVNFRLVPLEGHLLPPPINR